ncbi:hypothetical protein [Lysinibacillus xylanilyticus]|uniref:hypothetical protein n=1 Tax=Lysinibacillus xylanilyticus TaxID=582475 RepID=UPI003D077E2B
MTNIVLARDPGAKRLIGRPQEALLCAKAKRQQQWFICAKAKRQRQMFYLRESEAAAAKRPVGT